MTSGTAAKAEAKRVSWVELFFDLVFVFAISEVAVITALGSTVASLGLIPIAQRLLPLPALVLAAGVLGAVCAIEARRPRGRIARCGAARGSATAAQPRADGAHLPRTTMSSTHDAQPVQGPRL